jgi:hypothetical protein
MVGLINEAFDLQQAFEKEGRDFFFVGGLALQIWGQPRLTADIDCTIFTNLTNEDDQIRDLLSRFKSRLSNMTEALEWARTKRVVLLETPAGTGIDILLSGLADISSELERATYQQFTPDMSLKVCSAENLIAYKTVAGRLKDWADIETVLVKQNSLDWDYINEWLSNASQYQDIESNLAALDRLKQQNYRP